MSGTSLCRSPVQLIHAVSCRVDSSRSCHIEVACQRIADRHCRVHESTQKSPFSVVVANRESDCLPGRDNLRRVLRIYWASTDNGLRNGSRHLSRLGLVFLNSYCLRATILAPPRNSIDTLFARTVTEEQRPPRVRGKQNYPRRHEPH